jgi:hypothetical protein
MTRYQRTMANLTTMLAKARAPRVDHEHATEFPDVYESRNISLRDTLASTRARHTISTPPSWRRREAIRQPLLVRWWQSITSWRGHNTHRAE